VKAPRLDPKFWQRLEQLLPLLVFAFALAIRLFYDLNKSDQRLCSFGDGYFFLKTGQELAKALTAGGGFSDFLARLTVHTSEVAGGVATFGSGALGDRLLLDGPVYSGFLAVVHIISGIVGTTDYANNSRIFSIANSIVDSFSCVLIFLCGRLAFGSRAGLIAALLLAIYPASVLNTRLCYSELFTYFLFLLWSTLALALRNALNKTAKALSSLLAFCLGATSVLIVLARSFFAPLPVIGFLLLFFVKGDGDGEVESEAKKTVMNAPCVASLIAGSALVMAPWLWFTHEVTGKFTPWVNRAPGYNLFVGNQLYTDGWRTWPAQPGIPNETGDALKSISTNLSSDPVRFSGLQLRKLSRLGAGVWNDFQHRFFGIAWQAQNVFHDWILMFAAVGMITSLRANPAVRRSALVFFIFSIYHCLYACFEPVARYAITAMPFACLLAGQSLTGLNKPLRDGKFWLLLVLSAAFFALLNMHFSFIPHLFRILPTDTLAPIALLDAVAWLALWIALGVLVQQIIPAPTRLQRACVWSLISIFVAISFAGLAFDPARTEWSVELKKAGDGIRCDFILPSTIESPPPVAYLLVDLQTLMPEPQLTVTVNEKTLAPPVPVLQLMNDRKDAAEIYSLQAQAMLADPRSFRHWWAFPVPITFLSPSSPNQISISAKTEDGVSFETVKIFGVYPSSDEELNDIRLSAAQAAKSTVGPLSVTMPSINKFSWVKGFVTIDRRDPRPYEAMTVNGRVRNCQFLTRAGSSATDLSNRTGRQFGTFRMRLYMPPQNDSTFDLKQWSAESVELFKKNQEFVIAGGDPATMAINTKPIALPSDLNSSAFYLLSCELQRTKQKVTGGISTTLTAMSRDGSAINYTSPWGPTALRLAGKGWQKFSFLDRVPGAIGTAHDAGASIMISPFAADRLFLHRKNALRDTVKVRNVSLRYFREFAPMLNAIDDKYLY
jgi:hypothetical protein